MKLSFAAGRHQVDCFLSPFGLESYRMDGSEVLRSRSFARRRQRSFAVGEGAERHQVTIEIDASGRVVIARGYVDGELVQEAKPRVLITIIELVFVVAILGIVVAVLRPWHTGTPPYYFLLNLHAALKEFDETLAPAISCLTRERTQRWPARNDDVGWPPEGLRTEDERHLFDVQRDGGVLLRVFTKCHADETHCKPGERYEVGQVSFRPAADGPGGVVFLCGRESPPSGYGAVGENRTTLRGSDVPPRCR